MASCAIRCVHKLHDVHRAVMPLTGAVDEELADVLIFICAIANRLDIDLEDALRRKEQLNETRSST